MVRPHPVVDPYAAFRFVVEVNGTLEGGFSEVGGLEAETEVEDRPEGGRNEYVHKLAKHSKYRPLSLKRGITDNSLLWDWHQRVIAGTIERQTISVILRNAALDEVWRWVFQDAWPIKWSGSSLSAASSAVLIEAVDFAHHGVSRESA